jgi:hypothetical protein
MSRQTCLSKTVYDGGARIPLRASQKLARPVRNCLPNAVVLLNQKVVIELVDEQPTEEMISARERFWEKVFAELLPADEESFVKAKRKK